MFGLFRFLIPYLRGEWKAFLFGGVTVLLTSLFLTLQPEVFGNALDSLQLEGTTSRDVMNSGLIILGLATLQGIFRFLMRRTIIFASWRIVAKLREDVFAHLQNLHLGFYHDFRTGDIMSRATEDLEALRGVVGPSIMYTINTSATAILAVFFMTRMDPQLTLYSFIPIILTAIVVWFVSKKLGPAYRAVQDQAGVMSARLQDNLTGIRVVKTYGMEVTETQAFRELNEAHVKKNMRAVFLQGIMRPLAQGLIAGASIIVLWIGGRRVIAGTMTIGELVQFDLYLIMMAFPAISVGWVMSLIQRGASAYQRLNEIFEVQPAIANPDKPKNLDIQGNITLRNVTLRYNDEPVLNDIDLDIPAGETWGIVGPVGSGKSSLVGLIPRLYDVSEGQVLIDGHDVRELDLLELRKKIGFVPQETFLFSESIGSNIAFGDGDAEQDRIDEASLVSQLSEDIPDFPNGLDTLLGERGINLSGGQKQRTAIARALLLDPKILILDDALSAVDTNTEARILEQLRKVRKGRTTLIISHRISSVADADRIIVIDEGRVREQGAHQELLDQDGYYANLYARQLLEEEIESL